jgi:hypothetical protein
MKIREAFSPLLASVGLLWAAVSVLDPLRPWGSLLGPLLVLAALALRLARKKASRFYEFAAALVLAWGVAAGILIEFRADSSSYFAYLRSTRLPAGALLGSPEAAAASRPRRGDRDSGL